MRALRAASLVLYVLLSVATVGAVWANYGPLRAWVLGAVACAVPHWLPRRTDDEKKNENS